jgi:N-terminal acetyltransferase 2
MSSSAQETGSREAQSLSDRFKQLSKKYGWAAVGVYFGLSVLDFPFCFLAVRLVGPDRIGEVEHAIVHGFWSVVGAVVPSMAPESKAEQQAVEAEARETLGMDQKVKEDASMYSAITRTESDTDI